MSIKQTASFLLGATIFSQLLVTKDVLRYFGVPISEHGLTKNNEGKGMLEIWNECAPADKVEMKKFDIGGKPAYGVVVDDGNGGFIVREEI